MKHNKAWFAQLGSGGGLVTSIGVMRYVVGCITRERARLADAVRQGATGEELAKKILDDSDDEKIFRWAPPTSEPDDPVEGVR